MKHNIYIESEGILKRKDNTLYFEGKNNNMYIPVEEVNDIYLLGEIECNKKLLELLNRNGISIHFFNYYNAYIGSFFPVSNVADGNITVKQCIAYNSSKRLEIAKKIVNGEISSILAVLKYYSRKKVDFECEVEKICLYRKEIENVHSIMELMMKEARIRKIYYGCFNGIITNNDFVFIKRTKRPPKDLINSLISFGNSIMYLQTMSQIHYAGLNPSIGYLHSSNNRKNSLSLDISEIFKPIIVDRAIFTLLNKNMISKKDFIVKDERIVIQSEARRKFLSMIDNELSSTIKTDNLKNGISYRNLIKNECIKLKNDLLDNDEYKVLKVRW